MPCDKKTCKTCLQIKDFREFRAMLPELERDRFTKWFDNVSGELEKLQMDIATSKIEWRQDQERYSDESEERYQLRLKEWTEQNKGV